MLKLYDHPLSPYSQKVKIALLEKGLECDIVQPEAFGTGQVAGEFARANPRGEVPALVHDDVCVHDSTVILEYIEDAWPTPALLPAQPAERARVRMLEDVMDTHYEAIIWGLAEVAYFGRASGEQGAAITALAGEQIGQWNAWLEGQLAERAWFNGSGFGWGDLAVVPCVANAANYGFSPNKGSNLARWLEAVMQLPSVATVMGVAKDNAFGGDSMDLSGVQAALEAGLFKRQYRDHRLEWMIKTAGIQIVAEGLEKQNIRFTGIFDSPY